MKLMKLAFPIAGVAALVLLAGCTTKSAGASQTANTSQTASTTQSSAALTAEQITAVLQKDTNRPSADLSLDATRMPAKTLAFAGINKGMTVLDFDAAGGYYSQIYSDIVGQSGKVYAQNAQSNLTFKDGMFDKMMSSRASSLKNLVRVDSGDAAKISAAIPANSVDFAGWTLGLHDYYASLPDASKDKTLTALKEIFTALKPNGILLITDHVGIEGDGATAKNAPNHRIARSELLAIVKQAGFQLEGESKILANPQDDHTKLVFDKSIRRHTDRMVFRFTKPSAQA